MKNYKSQLKTPYEKDVLTEEKLLLLYKQLERQKLAKKPNEEKQEHKK